MDDTMGRLRDEEVVGSNPATPTHETAGHSLSRQALALVGIDP